MPDWANLQKKLKFAKELVNLDDNITRNIEKDLIDKVTQYYGEHLE